MRFHPGPKPFLWTAIVGALLVLVLLTGDSIRAAVIRELRFALFVTGAIMFSISTFAYIVLPAPPFGLRASAWTRIAGSGALVGFLLFILFIQDVECEVRGSGRGISTQCKQLESSS